MKVVLMTGNHPRHFGIARKLADAGLLAGLVIERREAHEPSPPSHLPAATASLFRVHFARRAEAEHRFFGDAPASPEHICERALTVPVEELNSGSVHGFLRSCRPDAVLGYGVHKLTPETIGSVNARFWNIHGGLSPWYRGVATHFWPSYLHEPQMTGMTLHETTQTIDAGAIIHQTAATLTRGDGLHDLASRTVSSFASELPTLLRAIPDPSAVATRAQGTLGKLWRSTDWRPEHLHVIYELWEDRVVDRVLDGGTWMEAKPFRENFPPSA